MKTLENIFKHNSTSDLVEYYTKVYEGKIRPVDECWVEAQRSKYEGCQAYMQCLANQSKTIYAGYSPNKSRDSKRTFVLWKHNSICSCLLKYGYSKCLSGTCEKCLVHMNCARQLEEIDCGTDYPVKNKIETIAPTNGKFIIQYKGHKIEVAISEDRRKQNENI